MSGTASESARGTSGDPGRAARPDPTRGVTVELPGALQPYAGGSATVLLEGSVASVAEALAALAASHPGVVDRILDERGEVRQHVNIFVDEGSIRWLDGLRTAVRAGSTIVVVPAVSGG